MADLNLERRDMNATRRPCLIHRKKFKSPSVSSDCREKDKAWSNNLSPSRKIIKEYKKSELQRYGAPLNNPDVPKPSITEWQVLYTARLTQKAKKFQDGFLRLAMCGSLQRQVMLYDASRKFLASRFLKTNETIRSGESIALEGFLVEIGEPEVDCEPLLDLSSEQDCFNSVGKTKATSWQHDYFKSNISVGREITNGEVHNFKTLQDDADTRKPNITEWQVMYTTQVTQKAKKYHDGFLKLAYSGSFQGQILLYDASRKLVDSRFLKKGETIKSGESIAFVAHLVDIGEPEAEGDKLLQDNLSNRKFNFNVAAKAGTMHGQGHCLKANISVAKGKYEESACLREDRDSSTISNVDRARLSNVIPENKPKRNACQILSILQRPIAQDSVVNGCADKIMTGPVSSAKMIQALDADINHPENCQSNQSLLQNHRLSENVHTGWSSRKRGICESADLDFPEAIPAVNESDISNDPQAGVCDQPHLDNAEADKCNKDFVSGISSAIACAPPGPKNDKKKYEQPKSAEEMDECPTFDLGF